MPLSESYRSSNYFEYVIGGDESTGWKPNPEKPREIPQILLDQKAQLIELLARGGKASCEENDCPDAHFGHFRIVIDELINNAIMHGNKCDPSKEVVVKCRFFYHEEIDPMAILHVKDEGEGLPREALKKNTEDVLREYERDERESGGFGLIEVRGFSHIALPFFPNEVQDIVPLVKGLIDREEEENR